MVGDTIAAVGLSVGKFQELVSNSEFTLDLEAENFNLSPRDPTEFPFLVFLKGLGFEKIVFRSPDQNSLNEWMERLLAYEATYIQDPESLDVLNSEWDQFSNQGEKVIECIRKERNRPERLFFENIGILGFAGPMNVHPEMTHAFKQEIRSDTQLDLLKRLKNIFLEFVLGGDSPTEVHAKLLLKLALLTLQTQRVDMYFQLTQEFPDLWQELMEDDGKLLQIIEAYDPRPHELGNWHKSLGTLTADRLIMLLENNHGTPIENRLVRLVQYSCLQDPDGFFPHCVGTKKWIKPLLLPALYTFWKPHHYPSIWCEVESALRDGALADEWIHALVHVNPKQALSDLQKKYFPRRFFKKSDLEDFQMQIIRAIAASRPPQWSDHLREWKKVATLKAKRRIEQALLEVRS